MADDRFLLRCARRRRSLTAQQLESHLSAAARWPISYQTVSRRLHEGEPYARRPVVCVPFSPSHVTARLNWAREHRTWTLEQWDHILFTERILKSSTAIPNGEDTCDDKNSTSSISNRWNAFRDAFRKSSTHRNPGELVSELRTPSPTLYAELRKHLKDPDWALAFVKENGVETLLDTLKSLQGRNSEEVELKLQCEQCLQLVMDSRVGLDFIMENADYTQKLAT
ncbi:uncharacterized protein LOC118188546, partial [Stegodyphus dumicola]|uniref:uncharacterized protein LOC118188546 n=1 Tax=Stegodyphus dumicola TaxID=202533 RepID=UPI0015ADFAE1